MEIKGEGCKKRENGEQCPLHFYHMQKLGRLTSTQEIFIANLIEDHKNLALERNSISRKYQEAVVSLDIQRRVSVDKDIITISRLIPFSYRRTTTE